MAYSALYAFALLCLLSCVTAHLPQNKGGSISVRAKRCSFGGCSVHIGGAIKTLSDSTATPASADPAAPLSRGKRCSFAGCRVTIGSGGSNSGSISLLTAASKPLAAVEASTGAMEEAGTRSKRCSFGGCRVHIGGDNSGSISLLTDRAGAEARNLPPVVPAAFTGESAKPADSTPIRNKRCSLGGCHVNVGGSNSGSISLLTDPTTRPEDTTAISSADSKIRARRCSFGGCGVNIGASGSKSGHIRMLAGQGMEPTPEGSPNTRSKRCSFGGCRVNIGGSNSGSINLLANGHEHAPAAGRIPTLEDPLARPKRCSFGGCSVTIGHGGSSSGPIKLLPDTVNGAQELSQSPNLSGGSNSGSIKMLHQRDTPDTTSQTNQYPAPLPRESEEPLQRHRGCSFGDCTVTIGGRNTGTVTGAHRVIEGAGPIGGRWQDSKQYSTDPALNYMDISSPRRCSFGPCTVNIPANNNQDIYM